MHSQGRSPEKAASSAVPPATAPAAPTGLLERWSYLLFLAGLIFTTSAPILMRLSEIGPLATAAWRTSLAVPVLALLLAFEPRDKRTIRGLGRRDAALLLLAGLFFAGDLAMWNSSVMLTSVASASFLANGAPLFVVLGSWLLFKERPSRLFLAGLAVGIVGSAVMMSESRAMSPRNLAGDLLSVGAAAFYACYLLVVARGRRRASTMTLMTVSSAVSAATLWAMAAAWEGALLPATVDGWGVLIATALLTHVAGQTLIALSLGYVSTNFSALILLLQPAIPTLAAWALFGETLSAVQAMGALAIVIGLALARPRQEL